MPSLLSRLSAATRAFLGREERGIPPPHVSLYQGYGMPANFKPEESLKAYGDNVWLYGGVSKIALELARTRFRLKKAESWGGKVKYVERHQALETLRRPQPIKGGRSMLTSMDLKYITGLHMLLAGEGFWAMDKRLKLTGAPTRLDILLPHYVYSQIGQGGDLLEYAYRLPEREIKLDPLDVVHFKLPDPLNLYRGHSPIQSIRYSIDTHGEADALNLKRLKNNAVPGGVLKSDKPVPEPERLKLLQEFKQMFMGSQNANKIGMLPHGLGYEKVADSNQEMQWAEGKQINRDEILANYGVGLEILGRTEAQTRANAEAAIFVFMKFGVTPFLDKFVDTLNNDYLPAFPGTDGLEFCYDDPVPENMEEKRANALALFSMGALTPNQALEMFGMEPLKLPGMDTPYLELNKVPVGTEPDPDEEPEEDPEPEDDPFEGDEDQPSDGRQRRAREALPGGVGEVFDEEKEKESLGLVLLPFLFLGFRKGVEQGSVQGSGKTKPEDVFTLSVQQSLYAQSFERAALAVGTTKDRIGGLLQTAIEEGQSVDQLAKAINDTFDLQSKPRSVTIARTELTRVINDATLRTLIAEGYTRKEWSTVIDGRERDSHHAADGQVVGIYDTFTVGGAHGLYPGDEQLPAGEVVNCRCVCVGAGQPLERKRLIGERFLRTHGSLERRLVAALRKEFERQKGRVLARLRRG